MAKPDFSKYTVRVNPNAYTAYDSDGGMYFTLGDGAHYGVQNEMYGSWGDGYFNPIGSVSEALGTRAASVKDLGGGVYDVEGQGYFAGENKLDRKSALDLIRQGVSVPFEALTSTGIGSDDGFNHSFRFAHVRSPAYQAMAENFDPVYGTKGNRQIAYAFADKAGINRSDVDAKVGRQFAYELENNKYSIYDPNAVKGMGQYALDAVGGIAGQAIPQEARAAIDDYNSQVHGLVNVPHPKKSGFVKQVGSDFAGGLLDVGGALLKPIGLEKFAAPAIGAGITVLSGGTLAPVAAAALGGAVAGALPGVAAGDYSAGIKGGVIGGAAGGLGGLASTYNPVTSLGSQGNLVANQAVQGSLGGAAEGLLTGNDPLKGAIQGGLLGGAVTGLSTGIQSGINAVSDAITPAAARQVDTGLSAADSFGAGPIRQPGINMDRFNPAGGLATDGLSVGQGGVGARVPTLPRLENTAGLVSTLRNAQGDVVAYQSKNNIVRPDFTTAIGDINSPMNNPDLLGKDVVQDGVVRNAGIRTPLTSKASDELSQRIIGGLLAGGAGVLATGLLSNRQPQQQQQMAPATPTLAAQQFKFSPVANQYTGDYSTYGERGSSGFRFYNAPVGLLG